MDPSAPAAGRENIVLIGMPGVGKSTIGVLLAKALSRDFLDTDVYIQARENRMLQQIIDQDGLAAFCRLEEEAILSLDCRRCVIATGGSVVYSAPAMEHLRRSAVVVNLELDLAALEERLTNLKSRGVVMAPGQTLKGLFQERQPLYRRYGDVHIRCADLSHEGVVGEIISRLQRLPEFVGRE